VLERVNSPLKARGQRMRLILATYGRRFKKWYYRYRKAGWDPGYSDPISIEVLARRGGNVEI
jgi:hypothetical protein